MIKAVLFDLDGTLLDTTEGVLESAKFAAKELGYTELPNEIMLKFVGPPIQNSFKEHYGCNEEEAQKAANIFRDYYKNNALFKAQPYSGIFELLENLKNNNIKMAVATYKREDYALTILEHFGFAQYFQSMHGADNFNKLTKADIVDICIEELGAECNEVVLVGDTMHDATGAENAGIGFVGVTYGFGFKTYEDVNCYANNGCANTMVELQNILLNLHRGGIS